LILAFVAGLFIGAIGTFVLVALLGVFLESLDAQQNAGGPKTASEAPTAEAIYAASGEEALAEARKFMVGTWTYTGTQAGPLGATMWIKWEVKADGSMLVYNAMATEDDWGTATSEKWEVLAGKFSNTGSRYYAFHIVGHATQAVIQKNGTLEYRLPDYTLVMERGDKFPFAK
jgi:hypothetical protein